MYKKGDEISKLAGQNNQICDKDGSRLDKEFRVMKCDVGRKWMRCRRYGQAWRAGKMLDVMKVTWTIVEGGFLKRNGRWSAVRNQTS